MTNIHIRTPYPNELYHHGIKGQKWGVRRFQNPDGSLTSAGRNRYLKDDGSLTRKGQKFIAKNETNRQILRSESFKGTKAQNSVSELIKMGFKDDGSGIDNKWLTKKLKTKHGNIEVSTSIDRNSNSSITGQEMRSAIVGMNKYGGVALSKLKKELSKSISRGEWGDGGIHIDNLTGMHVTKFRNGGGIICELSAAVKDDIDGGTYGWLSLDLDPKTGRMSAITYND